MKAPARTIQAAAVKVVVPSRGQDFYYFGNAPVMLDRSATEVVVAFATDRGSAASLLAEAAPIATVSSEVLVEGRAFHIITVPIDNGTSAVPSVIEQLRVSPDVELVADVFHYRKSGQLLAPTDEIVVKLK
ncbi:MAG TPA: hypothetical protein VF787_26690, partial [Thermoanaerobaculia bacterium]